jgi:hypothetical protein
MNHFYFTFDLDGPSRLPRRQDVERCERDHKCRLALQLDANVCLEIANFVNGREKQPEQIKSRVRSLLRSIALSGCVVDPQMGLLELGLEQGTLEINEKRYLSLASAVWEGLHFNLSAIEADHYTPTGFLEQRSFEAPVGTEILSAFFEFGYCSFLKVHSLAKAGLSAKEAVQNVREFLRWSDEELNMSIPFVLQFVLAFFGGESKVRKMLKIDNKDVSPLATAWGATQDLFSIYIFQLVHLGEVAGPTRALYVTRDAALFEVRNRLNFRALFLRASVPMLGAIEIDYDFPHFAGRSDEIREILESFQSKRLRHLNASRPSSPRTLIDLLEAELGKN